MMNIPCLYAIVRFCPFLETEEFANAGIIMIAPEHGFFAYKLITRRHARVTNFFEQLDGAVFKTAMQNLKEEFERAGAMLRQHGIDRKYQLSDAEFAKSVFAEIVRPREAVIKFSKIRGVLADDPAAKLEDLYGYYVERDFVTKEYREAVLERTMRRWIFDAGMANKFGRIEIGNEEYHATFPFVEQNGTELVQVVKPLNLAQDQPSKILDHGGQWLFRIQTLQRKRLLPTRVLFAVEGPDGQGPRQQAYADIVGNLRDSGATVHSYSEKEQIMRFVQDRGTVGSS
ncbi:DUF3037 domain-containing protein [Massilia antarctica]|uniref:DUF3037 domain-containing protein n=1 Tax=Massilia antarctica TaxID=2765360 RepID=UPI0006BB56EE|nr:DUF3037 domain-containing protein [Massilia sp. H27-R4]MCY0915547.1 DUF3037 domain-containing protein [Massilia sp. H27-R4]CUI04102.1 hypothetical protein BN2497_2981 [Janthinobacterium sp. CG23_2]CUU27888.1 hypothetical protein BN3177_2981 [Janthinobacterium sp. CG23_2]